MANAQNVGGHVSGLGKTNRVDNWWLAPLLVVAGLGGWGLYYMWAAWQAEYYAVGPYISPFYAPLLYADGAAEGGAAVQHAFFGSWPEWWPEFIPKSPAFFIFVFPATFRASCYYYRKAYYRAFFGMPPGCAVGPVPHNYKGETSLLVLQNLHRYTLYFAILLLPFLFYEGVMSFFHDGKIGIGIGSVLILLNAVFLSCYTFGCHAWRHLIGGRLNCFSCDGLSEAQHGAWSFSSWFNSRHMKFAWISLGWILLADVYIRLVSMGIIPDVNTWYGITWASQFGVH
jgi:hypothetical protein